MSDETKYMLGNEEGYDCCADGKYDRYWINVLFCHGITEDTENTELEI